MREAPLIKHSQRNKYPALLWATDKKHTNKTLSNTSARVQLLMSTHIRPAISSPTYLIPSQFWSNQKYLKNANVILNVKASKFEVTAFTVCYTTIFKDSNVKGFDQIMQDVLH